MLYYLWNDIWRFIGIICIGLIVSDKAFWGYMMVMTPLWLFYVFMKPKDINLKKNNSKDVSKKH